MIKIVSTGALVLAATGILIAVVLFVRLDNQQSAFDDQQKALVQQQKAFDLQQKAIVRQQKAIDQSRVDNTYQACEELNGRHKKAFAKLDELIDKLPQEQRGRAKAGEAGSKELINTLAPDQDCQALIVQRFGSDARPSP